MSFVKWFFNNEILIKLKKIEEIMSQNQEKIDALAAQLAKAKAEILNQIEDLQAQIDEGETVDLSVLAAAVQGIDDINPDEPSA